MSKKGGSAYRCIYRQQSSRRRRRRRRRRRWRKRKWRVEDVRRRLAMTDLYAKLTIFCLHKLVIRYRLRSRLCISRTI